MLEESERKKGQIPYIDRDPTYFNFILDYLRDPNDESIVDEFILKKILVEAKYFKLDSLVKKTEKRLLYHASIFKSFILNINHEKHLISLCEFSDQQRWKLLYRATRDGFSAENFHSKCDGKSNTLTVIRTKLGYVFGGFTTKPWSIIGKYANDPDAFIFSLINRQGIPQKFDCKFPEYAIYCKNKCGPSFGGGHDIYLCDNSNTIESSYSNLYYSYKSDEQNLVYNTPEAKSFLAGSDKFLTTEVEIFQKIEF